MGWNRRHPGRQTSQSLEQLVKDVIAAGGCLRVPRPRWHYGDNGPDYENRAHLATRFGKVPDGKRLAVITMRDELEIRLIDAPGRRYGGADATTFVVPSKVSRYHPAARAFRSQTDHHEVSRAALPRATRIVHAIAAEATRRRWSAEPSDGFLRITAGDQSFSVRLREQGVHARGEWERQVRHYSNVQADSYFYRDRVLPRGPYDADADGQLALELVSGRAFPGRQSRWGDRQSWSLEDRLGHVFREIEKRIIEAEHIAEDERIAAEERRLTVQREAEERERTWERLMADARECFAQDYLNRRAYASKPALADSRHPSSLLRRDGSHPRSDSGTAKWLAWARAFVDGVDPLRQPPTLPEPPEPCPEDLQPDPPPDGARAGRERWPASMIC